MEYDLFSRLFKYKETENHSTLENYLTELFVYSLQYFISSNKGDVICGLLDAFSIPTDNLNLNNIKVETQQTYYVKECTRNAIPDIKITINSTDVYFIECKVDSGINYYADLDIDQIQLYERIKCPSPEENKGVRTLTKYSIKSKSEKLEDKHKVLWSKISEILKNEKYNLKNDVITQNFLMFLEKNNMNKQIQLSYNSNGLGSFFSLGNFFVGAMTQYFSENPILNGYVINLSCSVDYFGFDITYRNSKYVWFGFFDDNNQNEFIVETYEDGKRLAESINKEIKDFDKSNNQIFGKINIEEIAKENDFEKQYSKLKDQLDEMDFTGILSKSYELKTGS